ncbi:nucleoside hydrolase [Thermogladius sp. 4427co]|uniref:nucleoside hydrolase n=1 Tax=Thermogladius sp. 4427co TaxID=3450718 RepID=UPI003F7ADB75
MVERVVIDTDPGVDDAIAILLALKSPELEILSFVSAPGNVDPVRGARNETS